MDDFKGKIEYDHVNVHVSNLERSMEFYQRLLGAEPLTLEQFRAGKTTNVSMNLGRQKLNIEPLKNPVSEVGHFCWVWPGNPQSALEHLSRLEIPVEMNLEMNNARGKCASIHFRDPDGNRLEFVAYHER